MSFHLNKNVYKNNNNNIKLYLFCTLQNLCTKHFLYIYRNYNIEII